MVARIINKNLFSSILFLSVIIFFIINFLFDIRFSENDDIVMALISSGKYSGSMDNHLVFINMIYATVINFFYYFLPGFEWYTIAFIVINIFSITLISLRIIKSINPIFTKVIFLLFLSFVFVDITIYLQFTKTAAVASITGIILMFDGVGKSKHLGICLFVLGSLIRFEAAFLTLLIVSPIYFLEYFESKKIRVDTKLKFVIIALAICLVFKLFNSFYYSQNNDWDSYVEYNTLRGKINDNPNTWLLFDKLPENISQNDYRSLLFFFPDPEFMDYEALKGIYETIDKVPPFTKIRHVFNLHIFIIPLILLLIIALVIWYNKNKKTPKNLIIVGMFAILVGVFLFLSLNAVVKYRVFFTALIAFVLILPFLLTDFSDSIQKKILLLSIFSLFLYFSKNLYSLKTNEKYYEQIFKNQSSMIDDYFAGDTTRKIVCYGGNYEMEYQKAFNVSSNFYENRMYFGGWMTQIPFHKNKFDSFKYFIEHYGLFVSRYNYNRVVEQIRSSIYLGSSIKVKPVVIKESSQYLIVEFQKENN